MTNNLAIWSHWFWAFPTQAAFLNVDESIKWLQIKWNRKDIKRSLPTLVPFELLLSEPLHVIKTVIMTICCRCEGGKSWFNLDKLYFFIFKKISPSPAPRSKWLSTPDLLSCLNRFWRQDKTTCPERSQLNRLYVWYLPRRQYCSQFMCI